MSLPLLQNEFPKFEGSTGGWLSSATKEEIYAISWTSQTASLFELPTGGTAEMNNGSNLAYFARKEQCLALGTQLRKFKITNYRIFRIYPGKNTEIDSLMNNLQDMDRQIDSSIKNESVINLIHPYDGVFPEKVNEGRYGVNQIFYSQIGTADLSSTSNEQKPALKVTPSNYLTLYFNYNLDKKAKSPIESEDIYESFSKDPWALLSNYNPELLSSLKENLK